MYGMSRIARRYHGGSDGAEAGPGEVAPGKVSLTGRLQRRAAGAPVGDPGAAFAAATAGPTAALPYRTEMEAAFDTSFAGVSAHLGTPEARAGLSELGAHAAALGQTVAFADANPDRHLVAHELAHVLQQRGDGGAVQTRAVELSEPGDAAEKAADRAADAVVAGQPVPDVGTASGARLHRAVNTNGGVFDNPTYQSYVPAAPNSVGWNAVISFTAGDLVEAPAGQIGLIQTVKGDTNRVGATNTLHATNDQPNTAVSADPEEAGLVVPPGQTGAGRAVDVSIHRGGGRTDANHNPLYGVGFGAADNSVDLTGGTPTLATTQRGDHVRNPDGTFQAATPAILEDWPWRPIRVAGQTFDMTFEVAALVTDGPMRNTYLGAVEWGWQSDAAGTVTGKPLRAVASGAPTAGFMGAASVWNAATFHTTDAAATAVPSIDLPITSLPSGVAAAVDLPTRDLFTRLTALNAELATLAPGSVDHTNKAFERRAVETELRRRRVAVQVRCDKISDTGSAARPPEDEIWLSASSTAGAVLTGSRRMRAGASHTFHFTVDSLWPFTAPIELALMEHDRGRGGGSDQELWTATWVAPFPPQGGLVLGNGEYELAVDFER